MEHANDPSNEHSLRARIFGVLGQSKTSEDGWVTILASDGSGSEPNDPSTLVENDFQIMKVCGTNGIAVSLHGTAGSLELTLDSVIYSEGFNRETFRKTLNGVRECALKVRALIEGG